MWWLCFGIRRSLQSLVTVLRDVSAFRGGSLAQSIADSTMRKIEANAEQHKNAEEGGCVVVGVNNGLEDQLPPKR